MRQRWISTTRQGPAAWGVRSAHARGLLTDKYNEHLKDRMLPGYISNTGRTSPNRAPWYKNTAHVPGIFSGLFL